MLATALLQGGKTFIFGHFSTLSTEFSTINRFLTVYDL
jgi:hypothetical protein